jgi:hypothetical protein
MDTFFIYLDLVEDKAPATERQALTQEHSTMEILLPTTYLSRLVNVRMKLAGILRKSCNKLDLL